MIAAEIVHRVGYGLDRAEIVLVLRLQKQIVGGALKHGALFQLRCLIELVAPLVNLVVSLGANVHHIIVCGLGAHDGLLQNGISSEKSSAPSLALRGVPKARSLVLRSGLLRPIAARR